MLRTKVMLGLGCLLIILLAMGLYSIEQCSDLGIAHRPGHCGEHGPNPGPGPPAG